MRGTLLVVLVSIAGIADAQHVRQQFTDDSLSINNIKCQFRSNGELFTRELTPDTSTAFSLQAQDTIYTYGNRHSLAGFEAPKIPAGTSSPSVNSIFTGNLWIAGLDAGNLLHVSAETYRERNDVFWPGPINGNTHTINATTSDNWDKIWHLTKTEISQFRANGFPIAPANIPVGILTWPANGNPYAVGKNGALTIPNSDEAPFIDSDGDGLYDPTKGDYPDIKGDEMLWFVFNDLNQGPNYSLNPQALGAEIQVSAYAFNCPNDSILNKTVFVQHRIINRSGYAYDSMYVGSFIDFDIGCYDNDYVGCDTTSSTYYGYNGTATDPDCASKGYGAQVPMQMVTMLKTPTNNSGVQIGMTAGTYYNNDFLPQGMVFSASEYYGFLTSRFLDTIPANSYHNQIVTKFVPFSSPNDTTGYSECSQNNLPGDRKMVATSGPFSLPIGSSQILEQAYIFHRFQSQNGCGAPFQAGDVQHIRDFYNGSVTGPCRYSNTAIDEPQANSFDLTLFPNPATNSLHYSVLGMMDKGSYSIMDLTGREIQSGEIAGKDMSTGTIDIINFPTGIYVFKLSSAAGTIVRRIVFK